VCVTGPEALLLDIPGRKERKQQKHIGW
jgi:hypothetical protein